MNRSFLASDLMAVASQIRRAQTIWEEACVYLGRYAQKHSDTYVEANVRRAYLALHSVFDRHGLTKSASWLRRTWRSSEDNLLHSELPEDAEEPYCVAIELLWEQLAAAQIGLHGPLEDDASTAAMLRRILERLPDAAHKAGVMVDCEASLHSLAEGILVTIWPDLQSKPKVNLSTTHREPDTGLPSIDALIEYKWLDSKKKKSQLLDEMLADIRSYAAASEWRRLTFVVAQTKRFFRMEALRQDLLKEPTTFDEIDLVIITF